jgi:hypothetical protein
MLPANRYVIRPSTAGDDPELRRIADLDSQRPLNGSILVGMLDGRPAAAISLEDARVVANPLAPTADLVVHLRMRAGAVVSFERTPSLPERLLAGIAPRFRRGTASVTP